MYIYRVSINLKSNMHKYHQEVLNSKMKQYLELWIGLFFLSVVCEDFTSD